MQASRVCALAYAWRIAERQPTKQDAAGALVPRPTCYTRFTPSPPASGVNCHATRTSSHQTSDAPHLPSPSPPFLSSTIGTIMKSTLALMLLALVSSPTLAAGRNCDELKAMLTDKIDHLGVKDYTLEIVDNADIKERKVIGSCEAGNKKIVYSKNRPST